MSSPRAASPDPLRDFLRSRISPKRLRRIASADYDRDGDGIAQEFQRNLDTGLYNYTGDGNPYECALMQPHDMTTDRPLNELFGAWWLGTFCSDPEYFTLIDSLGGVEYILQLVVRGCAGLGQDAAHGARAALPFVGFLRSRAPDDHGTQVSIGVRVLEDIERLGTAGAKSEQCRMFLGSLERS